MIKWVQRQWRAIAGGFAEREGVIEPVSGQAIIFACTRKLTTTAYTQLMVCQGHLFTTQRDSLCRFFTSAMTDFWNPASKRRRGLLWQSRHTASSSLGAETCQREAARAVCTCTTRWFDTSRGARAARLYTIGCPEDKETRHARAGHMFRCGPENNEYAGCYDALCNQAFRGFLSEA